MKHYTFIDYATQGYLALVAMLIVGLHNETVPHWRWLLLAHGVTMGLVHLLVQAHARAPAHRGLALIRHFYPVLLYTGFYRETGELNQLLVTGYLDPFFIGIDQKVFGCQPSLAFMALLPYWPVSELFYAAYFSYYVMIVGVGLALFVRDRGQFFHYVSVISFVFYVCYFTYILTPVMGPRIFHREIDGYRLPLAVQPAELPAIPAAVQAGVFFRIMAWIYQIFEAPGAAFPSSHVAVALATVYFSRRYLGRLWLAHLGVAILLVISTVYCRYHYVVDTVAGVVTAALLVPLGNWLYFRFRTPVELGPAAGRVWAAAGRLHSSRS